MIVSQRRRIVKVKIPLRQEKGGINSANITAPRVGGLGGLSIARREATQPLYIATFDKHSSRGAKKPFILRHVRL